MPTEPEDSTRDVLYPDDFEGVQAPIQIREYAYYEPQEREEDDESTPEDAQYGYWLPVSIGDSDTWMAAPEALRSGLLSKGAEEGDTIVINTVSRGSEDHDPYEISFDLVDDE